VLLLVLLVLVLLVVLLLVLLLLGGMMTPPPPPGTELHTPPAQEVAGHQSYSASCEQLSSPPHISSTPPSPVQQYGIASQTASSSMMMELHCLLVPLARSPPARSPPAAVAAVAVYDSAH